MEIFENTDCKDTLTLSSEILEMGGTNGEDDEGTVCKEAAN